MKDFIDKTENQNGTLLSRANLMAVQGFIGETAVFSADSVTVTNVDGGTATTTFYGDRVTTKFTQDGRSITQSITFNSNGYTKVVSA